MVDDVGDEIVIRGNSPVRPGHEASRNKDDARSDRT